MLQQNQKFGREANIVMSIVAVITAVLLMLWFFWEEEYLSHDEDLIYNLGLIGGIMMLLQFLYALRKRISGWRTWGNLKVWFAVHMFIGIAAPVIIVIHSRFEISSINGGVAFFSMLMVVLSGVIGRYLYSQVNFDLNQSRDELKRLHQVMQREVIGPYPAISSQIELQLKQFTVAAFAAPSGVISAFIQSFGIGFRSQRLYWQISQLLLSRDVPAGGAVTMAYGSVREVNTRDCRILKIYLRTLTKLARYNAFKQLFALWRIGHVPVIYLLLLTGIAHVVAVHMY